VASLYFVVRCGQQRSLLSAAFAGAAIGFALHARASVGLFIPFLGLYLLWAWARPKLDVGRVVLAALAFGVGLAGPLALLLVTNWWRFGKPLNFGYASIPLTYPIQDGLYGLFLSPGKSVLLYAPVVTLGLLSPFFVRRGERAVPVLCVAMGLANAVFFARFPYWHGDHTFGPRYLIMSIPFWVVPAGLLLDRVVWRRALAAAGVVGVVVALLGSVMYFNQYFDIAEHTSVPKLEILADGPNYWRKMHYDPYWSPVVGHARALPDVIRNSVARADGEDPKLQEYPGTTNQQYGWYFAPPQLDSWVYWLFPSHGPKRFLLLVPVLLALGALGIRLVRPALRS
jgi:4-amino-4-deoxy-L-arabinose transferase-like glycosyltransferase